MPMSFVDMASLERAARMWKFRKLSDGETEIQYRTALADFVQDEDPVESMEIRTGKGWDRFTEGDEQASLARVLGRPGNPPGTLHAYGESKAGENFQ